MEHNKVQEGPEVKGQMETEQPHGRMETQQPQEGPEVRVRRETQQPRGRMETQQPQEVPEVREEPHQEGAEKREGPEVRRLETPQEGPEVREEPNNEQVREETEPQPLPDSQIRTPKLPHPLEVQQHSVLGIPRGGYVVVGSGSGGQNKTTTIKT